MSNSRRFPASLFIPAALFFIVICAVLPFILTSPLPTPDFEIVQFAGKPEIMVEGKKDWTPVKRGDVFAAGDKLRTNDTSEVDLRIPGKIHTRLKEDSLLSGVKPSRFEKEVKHQLSLLQGKILATTDKDYRPKDGVLEISTPHVVTAVRGTKYGLAVNPETNSTWVAVLKGVVEVRHKVGWGLGKPMTLKSLQKTTATKEKGLTTPETIDRNEWGQIEEAHELISKGAAFEAKQMDLSKKGGDIFESIFDHGTFFTPKVGFASREFKPDPVDKEKVFLELNYDVFPKGSFVGVYFKTRDFDLSQYEGMKFDVRRVPGVAFPEYFKIELKSKYQIVRAFAVKNFSNKWETKEFAFSSRKPAPVTEITFVFSHFKVGEDKEGALFLKNFDLIPLSSEEVARRSEAAKKKAARAQAPAKRERIAITDKTIREEVVRKAPKPPTVEAVRETVKTTTKSITDSAKKVRLSDFAGPETE